MTFFLQGLPPNAILSVLREEKKKHPSTITFDLNYKTIRDLVNNYQKSKMNGTNSAARVAELVAALPRSSGGEMDKCFLLNAYIPTTTDDPNFRVCLSSLRLLTCLRDQQRVHPSVGCILLTDGTYKVVVTVVKFFINTTIPS